MDTQVKDRPRITRPGSGIAVDPGRVMAMRNRRLMSREEVSARVSDLARENDRGRPVRIGRDAVGKYETGQRRPSLDSLRALCDVFGCSADELMPGGPVITLPPTARARQSRLRHNRELRDFAIRHGLRYKNPRTGRVYYSRKLREAYSAHVAAVLAADQEAAAAQEAEKAAAAALDAAIAALRVPGGTPGAAATSGTEERMVS